MAASVRHTVRTLAVTLFLSAALWAALTASASAEVIRSFSADIVVEADSSLTITETIVYDFEKAYRHGIYRNISDQHAQPATVWYKERYVDLDLLSVTREGAPEPHTTEPYNGLSVRIGDPDRFVSGPQTYQIVYRASGALAAYDDGLTELYWNVTGDEWEVLMEKVGATVRTTAGVTLQTKQYCYAGRTGATTACDQWSLIDEGVARFTESNLRPSEQLTIAQALVLPTVPTLLERQDSVLLWLFGLVIWFSVLGVWLYRWRTTHQIDQAVVAQYEPFEDFKPMFTGVLFDNRLDSRDLTASIVYLAQQGFLKITQTTDKVLWIFETTDYELTLLRPVQEADTQLQKEALRMLFPTGSVGSLMKLADITKSQSRRRANYKRLQEMKRAAVKDLIGQGFLEQRISRAARIFLPIVAWFLLLVFIDDQLLVGLPMIILIVALLLSLVLVVLFGAERRTRKGFEALNHLTGFKEFLSTTEKERYKFHNAPSKSPEQFMEYLPYAIAFGVEKEWAEVFQDMTIADPQWYSSTSGAHFSAAAFTTDIGSFASALASSGASGSSGSFGGGSAGGGSGGGGGGSW